jgi:hypothetical protein
MSDETDTQTRRAVLRAGIGVAAGIAAGGTSAAQAKSPSPC